MEQFTSVDYLIDPSVIVSADNVFQGNDSSVPRDVYPEYNK